MSNQLDTGQGTADAIVPAALDLTAENMRSVMGSFCTGIVVITANSPHGPVGFTCQSFTSLSLDPPLVSFNPSRGSTSWPRIREARDFCVNILAEEHAGVSNVFAVSGGDKFDGVDWTTSASGLPVLAGVCSWVECELYDEHDGGDHTIVVGRVRALGADASRAPLLFHRGRYSTLAPAGGDRT